MRSEIDPSPGLKKQKLPMFRERSHMKQKYSNLEKFLNSREAGVKAEYPGIQEAFVGKLVEG
jgi:hypothetical protein